MLTSPRDTGPQLLDLDSMGRGKMVVTDVRRAVGPALGAALSVERLARVVVEHVNSDTLEPYGVIAPVGRL